MLGSIAIDGVVCTGDIDDRSYRAMMDSDVPFVLAGGLWRQQPAPKDVRIIGNDNFQGGRQATDHLLAAGHRRIALITGPDEGRHWKQRRLGYEAALREAGVVLDQNLMVESPENSAPFTYFYRINQLRIELGKMDLRDNFNQTTVILLQNMEKNPAPLLKNKPDQFKFTFPAGADVFNS